MATCSSCSRETLPKPLGDFSSVYRGKNSCVGKSPTNTFRCREQAAAYCKDIQKVEGYQAWIIGIVEKGNRLVLIKIKERGEGTDSHFSGLPGLLISRESSKCRLRRRRENSGSLILIPVKLKSPKVSLVSPRDPKKPSLRTSTLVSS